MTQTILISSDIDLGEPDEDIVYDPDEDFDDE
jgi:hypothetical protein